MSKQGSSFKDVLQNVFATSAILIAFIVSYILFKQIMGDSANFEGGNPAGRALQGNILGTIYKGGMVVPVLMTCVLVLIIFIFERTITLSRAKGKGRLNTFVSHLQSLLAQDKIENTELKNKYDVVYTDCETLYKESDIIALHVPLTPETKYLIDKNSISKMKRG